MRIRRIDVKIPVDLDSSLAVLAAGVTRRIDVYGTDTPGMLMRKVRLGTNDGSVANLARYYMARARARLPLPTR